MKKNVSIALLIFCVQFKALCETHIRAYFNRDCEKALLGEIAQAQKSIRLAIYSFTRLSIARELAKAAARGVEVRVLWDKSQLAVNKYGLKSKELMEKAGVKIFLVKKKSKMHHKFMVIDKELVITGSFNYTTSAATYNDENLTMFKDRDVAGKFLKAWEGVWREFERQ